MNNKGQVAPIVSHILLWVVAVIITGWLIYSATHNTHNENTYGPGTTTSDNHSTRWPFTIDLNFSCVPKTVSDNWGKQNATITNSVGH